MQALTVVLMMVPALAIADEAKTPEATKAAAGRALTFVWRDGNPGHAFVVVTAPDADGTIARKAYGLYPVRDGAGEKVYALGSVPDKRVAAALEGESAKRFERYDVTLTAKQHEQVERIRAHWAAAGGSKHLERDFLTFAGDIARAAELEIPRRSAHTSAQAFLDSLKRTNDK